MGRMTVLERLRHPTERRWLLGEAVPLTRVGRIGLLILVGAGVVVSLVGMVTPGSASSSSAFFQMAVTLLFALFAWAPMPAALGFVTALIASTFLGTWSEALLAFSVAFGCIVRIGTTWLIAAYGGTLLLAAAREGLLFGVDQGAAIFLVGGISGVVGLVLRTTRERVSRLAQQLIDQERREEDVRRDERQRIADEMHDVIAHDLTVIAMHARVLEHDRDTESRGESQRAIGDAARKALGDLRRVVGQVDVGGVRTEPVGASLPEAFAEARQALEGARRTVRISGDPTNPEVPRLIGGALARILRESVTNVLKHGDSGEVVIDLRTDASSVFLDIRNSMPGAGWRRDLPSGGYGTVRMAERARQLGGELRAAPEGRDWVVAVRLPIT